MTKPPPLLSTGTLGEQRHRIRVGGLVASETLHAPGFETASHAHERACLNLVLEGGYGEESREGFHVYPPMTLILKPAGEPHANRFANVGARCLLIEFDRCARHLLGELGELLDRPSASPAGPSSVRGIHALRAIRGEGPPAITIEEVVLQILRDACRRRMMLRERTRPRWLATVRERIHATAPERLRLDELASENEVHPVHLSETFRRFYGITISGYVERLRLERAIRALAETDEPVARIAVRSGFYDHAHLGRVFRRATGSTPTQFRSSVRT